MDTNARQSVLLIEDDSIFRRRYRRELAKHYDVSEASSLDEALKLLKSHDFQYILSDLHLSKDSEIEAEGLQLIAQAKSKSPKAFISAMSSDVDLKQQAILSGADDFVEKPFPISDLIASWAKRTLK